MFYELIDFIIKLGLGWVVEPVAVTSIFGIRESVLPLTM